MIEIKLIETLITRDTFRLQKVHYFNFGTPQTVLNVNHESISFRCAYALWSASYQRKWVTFFLLIKHNLRNVRTHTLIITLKSHKILQSAINSIGESHWMYKVDLEAYKYGIETSAIETPIFFLD